MWPIYLLFLLLNVASIEAIINSPDANPNVPEDYAHLVAWFNSAGVNFCAGSLITEQHVLTAAHCFMNVSVSLGAQINRNAVAGIGIYNLRQTFPKYRIQNVFIHPTYTYRNFNAAPGKVVDLAVVKLTTPVDLRSDPDQKSPMTIVLANKASQSGYGSLWNLGDNAILSGWGDIRGSGLLKDFSTTLKKMTNVKLSDSSICEGRYEFLDPGHFSNFNGRNYICSQIFQGQGGGCFGDGGAPLIRQKQSGGTFNYQIGVFSGNAPYGQCGRSVIDGPGALQYPYLKSNYMRFTNVEVFGPWIQAQTFVILPYDYFPIVIQRPRPTTQPTPVPAKTCGSPTVCGGRNANGQCWCDASCRALKDCCTDFQSVCSSQNPTFSRGSCANPGVCGYKSSDCWCDKGCKSNGDCCNNFVLFCGLTEGGGEQSCVGQCGRSAVGCFCDDSCINNGDCCLDYDVCIELNGMGGSCVNNCGKKSGACWCDAGCTVSGDCCPNYRPTCGSPGSCQGYCGKQSGTCWCDITCKDKEDCCADMSRHCAATVTLNLQLQQVKLDPRATTG